MRQHVRTHRNDKNIVAAMLAELKEDIRAIFEGREDLDLRLQAPRIDLTDHDSSNVLSQLAEVAPTVGKADVEEDNEEDIDPYDNPVPGPSHEYAGWVENEAYYYVEPADPPSETNSEPRLEIATEDSDDD